MANRHLLRSIVLQTLFEWDFRGKGVDALKILHRNVLEFSPETGDFSFMEDLLNGVMDKISDLNNIIEKAAPDWPVDRISVVDRNALRIGLYELLFSDHSDVPPKVAINEAIELAKTFSGDTGGKFVNGVLGAVYKELGEPGKNQTSKKLNSKNIPTEELFGAVVYAENEGEIYLALVHDVFGHWTLSKGHSEDGESRDSAVSRIVKREMGLDNISIEDVLGENEYIAHDPEKDKIRKHVRYVLAGADFKDLELSEGGGLDDAKWFKLKDILDLNFYNDILPIITKAVNILLKKTSKTDKKQ